MEIDNGNFGDRFRVEVEGEVYLYFKVSFNRTNIPIVYVYRRIT